MSGPSLVMCDVDAVQAWLFQSVHLREIAGASQLLADYDDEAVLELAADGKVLSSGGGTALVRFDEPGKAQQFQQRLPRELLRRTVNATVTVSDPQTVGAGPFGEAVGRVLRDVEHKKRLGRQVGEYADASFALRCQGCGREPVVAEGLVTIDDEPRQLGAACLARHNARRRSRWLGWMRSKEGWQNVDFRRLPADANDLTRGGKLALVLADVNGVGERLVSLHSETSYCDFSAGLSGAVREALVEAVASVETPSQDDAQKLRLEVLYAGGDDLLVACRGDRALEFVQTLVTEFTARASGDAGHWCGGVPLGMSAAVVVVGAKFPFRTAHAIARRLLQHAKRVSREREWQEGAVEWAVVTEAWAEGEQILADRVIESSSLALHLTGRPYRACSSGPHSLGSFQDACKELVNDFPRNKLFDLRGLCSASQLAAVDSAGLRRRAVEEACKELSARVSGVVSRLPRDPEVWHQWESACSALGLADPRDPFWREQPEWRTPVGDFAEGIDLWGYR